MSSRQPSPGPVLVLIAALVVSVVLTTVAFRSQGQAEDAYALARIGVEDVARRVERSVRNLKNVKAASDVNALSKAKSLAEFIARDPSVLKPENRARFDSYAQLLAVDELHVVDRNGILVRSFPSAYEGRNMAHSKQSAAFLPAITNAQFALVQDPQGKGLAVGDHILDDDHFQYAGVARRDEPGIVQVGYRAERIAEAMKLMDVNDIAETTRIGLKGRVRIKKTNGAPPPDVSQFETLANGERKRVFSTDCEGYRVSVLMPVPNSWLAQSEAFDFLFVLDLLLVLLVLSSLPVVRALLARDWRTLRDHLSVRADQSSHFFEVLTSPLSLAALAFFCAVIVIIGVISARSARHLAQERLRAAAADMVDALDDCVGKQLAFIGRTICDIYRTPEEMKNVDLVSMMKAHGLDELNVIDGHGFVVASSIPEIVGDNQWKKANPAKFNRALLVEGHGVFAQSFRESADEPGTFFKYVGVAFAPPVRGYLQLGFKRERLKDSLDYSLEGLARNWHIGESGFFVISKTKNGEILSSGLGELSGKTLAEVGFDGFAARERQNVERRDPVSQDFLGFEDVNFFESVFDGRKCLCTSGVSNQYHRYVAAIPLAEVYGVARRNVAATGFVLFVALVLAVLFMTRLSNLVRQLQGYIAAEKDRQIKDLTLAKTIQASSLPLAFPDESDYAIYATMDTAREVGGDFFDFYAVSDDEVLFLVADVSGKGIPAALFMMKAKAMIRAAVTAHSGDLSAAVAAANDELAEHNDAEMFVTGWIGLYDRRTGVVAYVNAGHNPPLVRRADGSVEWVRERSGLVLAAMGGATYRMRSLQLRPGDSLFLYTDGVTEAMNVVGELYGEERLERTLAAACATSVTDVRADLKAFVAGAEQSDDITMLTFDVKNQ